jgi:hypothetical protein
MPSHVGDALFLSTIVEIVFGSKTHAVSQTHRIAPDSFSCVSDQLSSHCDRE